MLKQYVSKIILFTGLMTGLGGVSAAPAWATVNPIWSGNVRQAVQSNRAALTGIEAHSDDCEGLGNMKSLLALGADLPATEVSGELGEIRTHLVTLELTSSVMRLSSTLTSDTEILGAYATVLGLRNEAFELLEQKLAFCGNGVERESAK